VTLLFGVRDNDMKDLAATDFDRLAVANADPEGQREHCLRAVDHDEPTGPSLALGECRAFVRDTLLSALDGLDAEGRPDGNSVLLTDLVGAPAGSTGPFLGLSFLGVEWKYAPGFYLTIDPTYIAFPIPHVTGAPFGYLQYRFLVGLEFGG